MRRSPRFLQCPLHLQNRISVGDSNLVSIHNIDQHCSDLWSHQLQQDVIDNILERLGALDRIRFSAVCSSWRAAVGRSTSTSALEFPLVLHAACSSPPEERLSISSLDENRYYYLNRFYTHSRSLSGIIEGRWLIMVYRFRIPNKNSRESPIEIISYSILNPVTGKTIVLPPLSENKRHLFRIMVASSEPTTSNCIVAGAGPSSSLAFCRLTDITWTFLNPGDDFKDAVIYHITFLDGKLYFWGGHVKNLIIVFDLENKNGVYNAHKIVMATRLPISFRSREEGSLYSYYLSFTSLASDLISRELLLIICDVKLQSTKKFESKNYAKAEVVEVVSFRVYAMNIANGQNQWIKVTNLGGRILFYGNRGSFIMSSKVFGESTHQDNSIYYALWGNEDCCDVGKFCLNDQTIIRYPTKRRNGCAWFVPTAI